MKYWILASLAVGMCLINVWHSLNDVHDYGGTDLRVRVVGSRALLRGINPYTIQETDDLDPELRDPDQLGLSRCTYPQTLLFFYAPLSSLDYPGQRAIWATLEWCAFAGSVTLLCLCLPSQKSQYWFAMSAVGLFAGSFFWRLHVERGQYYIFVVLLISTGMFFLMRKQQWFAAGFCWGLAICLRPTVVFLIIPWLTGSQRKVGFTAISTAVIGVAGATLFGRIEYWFDFLKLSRSWELSVLGAVVEGNLDVVSPGTTDGYNSAMLDGFATNLTFDSLAQSLQTSLNFRFDPPIIARIGKFVWLFVLAAIWMVQQSTQKQRLMQVDHRILVGVCLMLVTDYFLPIRIEYADIMFMIPLALLMPTLMQKQYRAFVILCLVAMLIPMVPISLVHVNAAGPAAMLRSCVAVYLMVRFTICGPANSSSA